MLLFVWFLMFRKKSRLFLSFNFPFLEDYSNIIGKKQMRRGSTSKSSMFKMQNERNHYKDFLENVDRCKTVRLYPHLLEVRKKIFLEYKKIFGNDLHAVLRLFLGEFFC